MDNNILFIMAFVCQSDRNLTVLQYKQQPGPAYYVTEKEKIKKEAFAPFLSTVLKAHAENHLVPGPGSYEIKRNIGDPTITTYTNKSSIVIRVNSQGTAPFISKQARFQRQYSPQPGPGSYISIEESKFKAKPKQLKKTRLIQPRKNAPSIVAKITMLSKKRSKTQETIKNLKNLFSQKKKESRPSRWAMDKVKRFKTQSKNIIMGPGKYKIDGSVFPKHKSMSAGFASKTVRTYFDTIMYDTVSANILQSRKQKGYKNQMPGPGAYEKQVIRNNESEKYKIHSFGSCLDRFKQKKSLQNDLPFYDVHQKKTHYKEDPQFRSEVQRSLTVPKEDHPGPGYYEPLDNVGKIMKVQIGNFGSKVRRSGIEIKGSEYIGPGSYESTPCKTEEAMPSSYFCSDVPRFSNSFQDTNFGTYDLFQHDISRKALCSRLHRQNLQKIQCVKPPFDSQLPRFNHYQSKKKEQQKASFKQQFLQFVQTHEQQRSQGIQQARNQISTKKSTVSKSKRFLDQRGGPGVGDYNVRDRWMKKSYNIKYKANDG